MTIKDSFDDLELWRKEFILHAGLNSADANSYPFVLIGNKVDKETERVVIRGKLFSVTYGGSL